MLPILLSLALPLASALTYSGVDWSSVAVEESSGITYTDISNNALPLEQILASAGVTTVRQRLWVNPSDGTYDLAYNLALAKRASSAGLGVYLDLHLSDTWADPANQVIPSGWPTSIDDLAWTVYNYTRDVANSFADAGLALEIVSIGNEITTGMLLPTGSTDDAYSLARLLNSAAWGIKDSSLAEQPKIMIHLDNGWKWETQQWWYDAVLGAGPLATTDFDMMGVSYYPFYNSDATLSSLKTSLANLAATWSKSIVVAETNWPISCPSPAYAFPSDLVDIPFSAAGQVEFVKRVASVVEGVSGGEGLFYWEPAWVDNAALGSSCELNTMFAWPGKALESLNVFGEI